jgi:excisionase family DNA binding protein
MEKIVNCALKPVRILVDSQPLPVRIPSLQLRDETKQNPPIAVCASTAAKMLNISEPTLRKLTRTGKIKYKKIGRKILYSIDNLKKFLNGK